MTAFSLLLQYLSQLQETQQSEFYLKVPSIFPFSQRFCCGVIFQQLFVLREYEIPEIEQWLLISLETLISVVKLFKLISMLTVM